MENIQEQLKKIYEAATTIGKRVFGRDVDRVELDETGDWVTICYYHHGDEEKYSIAVEDLADPAVSGDRIAEEIAEANRIEAENQQREREKREEILKSEEYAQYRELRKKFIGL